jgi:CHASE3 domain sensor protein
MRSAVAQRAALQAHTASLLKEMVDNETGQRGYVLSQNPIFLEPYDQSLVTLPRLRQSLGHEIIDPEARRLFANLDRSVDRSLAFAAQSVELQRSGAHAASVALILTGRGKKLMDQVRADAAALEGRLAGLIRRQEAEYAAGVQQNEWIAWSLAGVDALFVALLVALLLRLRRAEQILLVCAWSKTVQYEGEWISYDQYLTRKFGFSISHGISPEEGRKMREMVMQQSEALLGG